MTMLKFIHISIAFEFYGNRPSLVASYEASPYRLQSLPSYIKSDDLLIGKELEKFQFSDFDVTVNEFLYFKENKNHSFPCLVVQLVARFPKNYNSIKLNSIKDEIYTELSKRGYKLQKKELGAVVSAKPDGEEKEKIECCHVYDSIICDNDDVDIFVRNPGERVFNIASRTMIAFVEKSDEDTHKRFCFLYFTSLIMRQVLYREYGRFIGDFSLRDGSNIRDDYVKFLKFSLRFSGGDFIKDQGANESKALWDRISTKFSLKERVDGIMSYYATALAVMDQKNSESLNKIAYYFTWASVVFGCFYGWLGSNVPLPWDEKFSFSLVPVFMNLIALLPFLVLFYFKRNFKSS